MNYPGEYWVFFGSVATCSLVSAQFPSFHCATLQCGFTTPSKGGAVPALSWICAGCWCALFLKLSLHFKKISLFTLVMIPDIYKVCDLLEPQAWWKWCSPDYSWGFQGRSALLTTLRPPHKEASPASWRQEATRGGSQDASVVRHRTEAILDPLIQLSPELEVSCKSKPR